MIANLDVVPTSDRTDAFHELLSTLARALDVREVFQRLSEIVARIIPHDEANLALLTEDGTRFRLFASTHDEPEFVCPDQNCFVQDPWVARIFDGGFGTNRGFYSGLKVPVQVDGRPIGVLVLLSWSRQAFSDSELKLAQRVADYVAIVLSHERLAEAERRAALERDRAANLESSVELLRAIAGVLDIRTVFPQISEIANKVLPHDHLSMAFKNGDGTIDVQASSSDALVEVPSRIRVGDCKPAETEGFFIVDDLLETPLSVLEPADLSERVTAAGFRSFFVVVTQARDQQMGLQFWSKRPRAFSSDDVPIARRIADHVALAVSHEQLAEAARQVAEARARAERLEARVKFLAEELDLRAGHGRVVGQSSQWKDVLKKGSQVAQTETTVLLTGESGTGKEVVARVIHRTSARRDGPFVAINCAALPEQLLESELFGHERGAFTGAQVAKPGQIELASGGVLFLDEVSEMSLAAQAKFLRVLQEREFQRLGGTRPLKANVRVIAATNRDLQRAVERGTFREDLFYRLQVFDIHIPPLRERKVDVLPLSESFLQEIGRSFGRPPAGLTRDAQNALLEYKWPGNVRELRNALERAAILCEGGLITAQHLSLKLEQRAAAAPSGDASTDLNIVERQTIEQVMRDTRWNKSKAADRLGLSRKQLYVRLRRYQLEEPTYS
jgi:transcriptional regulator with GAF, ATPase, and Fis domain